MSLVTDFNFKAFECDASRSKEGTTKTGVSLSVLTSEEMKRLAVVRVTTPCGKENSSAPWNRVVMGGEEQATLWDTRMGNFDLRPFPTQACTTCSQDTEASGRAPRGNLRCSGHFGYIGMPSIGGEGGTMVVYNPILFSELYSLLRAQCFFCHSFRASPVDCLRWYLGLELFDLGLTAQGLAFLEKFKGAGKGRSGMPAVAGSEDADNAAPAAKRTRPERQAKQAELDYNGIDGMKRYAEQVLVEAQKAGDIPNAADREHVLRAVIDLRNELVKEATAELMSEAKACATCGAESPTLTTKDGQVYVKFSKLALDKLCSNKHITAEQKEEYLTEMRVFQRERCIFPAHQALRHIMDLCAKQTDLISKLLHNVGGASVAVQVRNPLPPTEVYKALFLDCILVPPVNVRLASGVKVQDGGSLAPDERTKTLSHILVYVAEIEAYYTLRARQQPTTRQQLANEANIRNLQLHVDQAYGDVLGSFAKKEGLFRMNMMGKRVNQACRSVISPDFTVEPNEILLPRSFARNLSYPEQVTFHDPARTALLRKCVLNGSAVYPGATHIEYHEGGSVRVFPVSSDPSDVAGRTTRADHAITAAKQGRKVVVYRHVLDGDRLIFNRQPTLHRPSMQSYEAKVLSGLKTLRFHYVSGKSYNADFDGDEMNVHVPQSIECRAELATVMDSNLNYLVPTSGRPIRGLIQDHCAAGVFLTMRDRFFDRDTFTQLVYLGLQPYLGKRGATEALTSLIPVPAVLKPKPLWTGKQVVSVVLRFVTGVDGSEEGPRGITMHGTSMVYTSTWTTRDGSTVAKHPMADEPLLVVGSELLVGVLDKNQLGPTNMSVVHALHEVYGPHSVGRFFGALGRILTYSLRYVGFSIGLEDMMLTEQPKRRAAIRDIDLSTLGIEDEGQALSVVSKAASKFHSAFLPKQLRMHFPRNDLVTMTQSGAKGSNTNAIQMALTLGQQTFSGQRIHAMTSGKTAPSFFAHETRARSKGFAMGRFVSGIRPAEYTIHAMAGRDGLIDTAVKTARSGYLQRCLIKGLESLTTQWDGTVRDANGSVVQFRFGGDGLDPCKASTLNEYQMVYNNRHDLARRYNIDTESTAPGAGDCFDSDDDAAGKPMSAEQWQHESLKRELEAPLPAPYESKLRRQEFNLNLNPRTTERWRRKGTYEAKMEREKAAAHEVVQQLTRARIARAGSEAGEPVGIVAAQAAGEPSTQMTLNTFHQAGQTVTHVTEGIPRLRELLMFASVAQPAVIIPVSSTTNNELEVIQKIIGRLTPKRLKDCLAPIHRPFRWHVRRTETTTELSVVLLFSASAIDRIREASGASRPAHVASFAAALKNLAKRLVMRLKGVVRSAAETGSRKPVSDPAELLDGDEEGQAVRVRDENASDDDDDDVEGAAATGVEDDEDGAPIDDDDDDGDNDALLVNSGRRATKTSAEEDGGNEESRPQPRNGTASSNKSSLLLDDNDSDDDALVPQFAKSGNPSSAAPAPIDYGRFPTQDSYFLGGTVHTVITPMDAKQVIPSNPASHGGSKKKGKTVATSLDVIAKDLYAARIDITLPGAVVAVVPDLLKVCLDEVRLPSDHAQVEEALWIPDSGKDSGQLILQGEGAKIRTALRVVAPFADRYPGLDPSRITSTDVRDLAETFGIEAANKFLDQELQKLFKRHAVDARHCSLTADVATFRGHWHAFNFNGMIRHSSSPLFQMTFASSRKFLEKAVSRGVSDDLRSFSAAIMVGEKPRLGTGTVSLSVDPKVVSSSVIKERPAGTSSGLKPMRSAPAVPPPME